MAEETAPVTEQVTPEAVPQEPSAEVQAVEPAEAPTEQVAEPKGKPDPQKGYERVKSENKQLKGELDYLKNQVYLLQTQVQQPIPRSVEPAQVIDGGDDEFLTKGEVKRLLAVVKQQDIEPVKAAVGKTQQDLFWEKVEKINSVGRQRFQDFDDTVEFVNRETSRSPYLTNLIMNSPDPAVMAYNLGKSYQQMYGGNGSEPPITTNVNQGYTPSEERHEAKTVTGIRSGAGNTNSGMTFEQLMRLPMSEYEKIPKNTREQLREAYDKRNQSKTR